MGVRGVGGINPPPRTSIPPAKTGWGVWQFFPRSKKLFGDTGDFFFCSPQAKFLGVGGYIPPPQPEVAIPQQKKRAHVWVGDTVNCQVREINSETFTIVAGFSEFMFYSHTQRVQVCVNNERLGQNHFICHDFRCETKPQFSLLMVKFDFN
jgi:hypothetical protein